MTHQQAIRQQTLPATMRAAVQTGIGRIEIVERPVPRPGPSEALVRLRAIGICGSDVHYYADGRIGDAVVQFPFLLGHEPAGEVAALGDGVTGLAVGDRVALEPSLPCGQCETCRTGHPNCCPSVKFLGTPPVQGTFEEYHLYDARQCLKIPDNVSFEAAATLEPMAVGVHAVNNARLAMGARVAIMGSGPIGIVTAMAARAAGASFIAMTDPVPSRREHAARYADLVLDPRAVNAPEEIARAAGAIDVAFEAAGDQGAIDDATLSVRPAGTAVIIGIPAVDQIALWAHLLRRKELTIVMSRRSNLCLEATIRLMAADLIRPEEIVTHRFPLERVSEGIDLVHEIRDGVLKAMVIL
jgi:L-iditol 2-dehydrogenase